MKTILHNISVLAFLLIAVGFIGFGWGCSPKAQNPEDTVQLFLEAASYGDTSTMKELCVGKMNAEIVRDDLAIKKIVFLELQGIEEQLPNSLQKNVENTDKTTKKKPGGDFDFSFQIMRELTSIEPEVQAKVTVALYRKGRSITRTYELVWVNSTWMIAQYYNEEGF